LFGTNGSQLYSDLKLRGLKPPPKGQAYVLWFLLSGNRGFPVPAVLSIGQNGTLQQRITIPSGEIPIAQRAQALDVSLAQATAIESAIKSAFKQKRLVQEPGTVVLRGTIPASGTSSGGGTPKG
jgi:hypothetical protein